MTQTTTTSPTGESTTLRLESRHITKAEAASLIETQSNWRKSSPSRVRYFRDAINHGRFQINSGQVVCLDRQGRLRDGQHRLMGFLASDADVLLIHFVVGVDEDCGFALDQSLPRTLKQALEVHGATSVSVAASAARVWWGCITQADDVTFISKTQGRSQIAECVDLWARNRETFEWATRVVNRARAQIAHLPSAAFAQLALWAGTAYGKQVVEDFVRELCEVDESVSPNPIVRALRLRIHAPQSGAKIARKPVHIQMAYYVPRTFLAWVDKEDLSILKMPKSTTKCYLPTLDELREDYAEPADALTWDRESDFPAVWRHGRDAVVSDGQSESVGDVAAAARKLANAG